MKGIINETYFIAVANQLEMDENDIETPTLAFKQGEEVEILKEVTGDWIGGKAYIIYSEKRQEALAVATIFVDTYNGHKNSVRKSAGHVNF